MEVLESGFAWPEMSSRKENALSGFDGYGVESCNALWSIRRGVSSIKSLLTIYI